MCACVCTLGRLLPLALSDTCLVCFWGAWPMLKASSVLSTARLNVYTSVRKRHGSDSPLPQSSFWMSSAIILFIFLQIALWYPIRLLIFHIIPSREELSIKTYPAPLYSSNHYQMHTRVKTSTVPNTSFELITELYATKTTLKLYPRPFTVKERFVELRS